MARTITTRPARAEDEDFRREVYFSTRIAEVAEFGWSDDQQKAFLQMQFSVRQRAYEMQFPKAESSIILVHDAPAGTMIVDRAADHISLTDIAILPEYRNSGIATHLIRELQEEARTSRKSLILQVDKANTPAKNLYEKLGFITIAESEMDYSMKWPADS